MADLSKLPHPSSSPELEALWNQASRIAYHRFLRQVTIDELVDAYADLLANPGLRDEPDLTALRPPAAWTVPFAAPSYPVPGLALRQLTLADFPAAWDTMYAAGMTGALGTTRLQEQIVAWFNSPDCWFLVLEYNGRPLQYEVFQWVGKEVWAAFTTHIDRERTGPFWAMTEEPLFRLMLDGGYRMFSRSTAKYPGWIDGLKGRYDVALVKDDGDFQVLEFLLPGTLAKCAAWAGYPVTVKGFDYAALTKKPSSVVEVREITLAEALPAIEARWALRQTANAPANKAIALRVATERVPLDRATLLGGFVDGDLMMAASMSPKGNGVVGRAILTPLEHSDGGLIEKGFMLWCKAAGSTRVTTWHREWLMRMVQDGRYKMRLPWNIGRKLSTGSIESWIDIDSALARPEQEWAE